MSWRCAAAALPLPTEFLTDLAFLSLSLCLSPFLSPSLCALLAVYYIGIIDVLQTWDFTKRMENWFKTSLLRRDAEGVSAIPPGAYAERFRNRVLAQLIEGYETPR